MRVSKLNVIAACPAAPTRAPVLFVHGYFVDARVWTAWVERFASHGIPAYAVHLRGRAGSGPPNLDLGRASIQDFVDDASAVAREVGATAVVGHSMGGLIAQKLVERGDVSCAALIAPAPPRGITVLSLPLAIKQAKYLPAILRSRLVHPHRDDLRELVMNCMPRDQQDALLDLILPDSGRAGRDMSITGVPVNVARVRAPMLAIAASNDRFIPARTVARVAARYGATLEIVPNHGHMIIVEPGWESLADRVETWIRQHP